MCNPALAIAAAGAALQIGQSVVQYKGQQFQSEQAATYANLNYANRYNIVQQQGTQLSEERSQKAMDSAIAAAQSGGRISASAADMGFSGASLEQSLNADLFGLGRQSESEAINDRNQREQLGNELTGAGIERASTIASHPKPSSLGLVLGIGQAVTQAAGSYKQMSKGS